MGTNDGAIHEVEVPIHLTGLVGLLLQGGQDALPDAGGPPAVEATGDRLVVAVALGQVLPGSAGTQEPLDTIDDGTMVVIRPPGSWFLGRQQRRHVCPLLVGKVITMHTSRISGFADTP